MQRREETLRRIAEADDLRVAPFREEEATDGAPIWIWSAAVDGGLFARACNGTKSRWHRAAMRERARRIAAGGRTIDVALAPIEGPVNDRIDEAYRARYRGSPYLAAMTGARARAATVRITPAGPEA